MLEYKGQGGYDMQVFSAFTLFALIIFLYLIIAEVFTILFRFTGLDKEKASFQVVSLLTGSGYTTDESELVTSTRQRRRLAKITMMFGYVFNITFVSAFVNIFFSFRQSEITNILYDVAMPIAVFVGMVIIFRIPVVTAFADRVLESLIGLLVKENDYNPLTVIDNLGGKTLASVYLKNIPDNLKDKKIQDSGLKSNYGIIVLLDEPAGEKPADVHANTILRKYDRVTVLGDYGQICQAFKAREHFTGKDM